MVLFFLSIGFLVSLPIGPVALWAQAYYRSIDSRLEKDRLNLETFTGVGIPFLIILLQAIKGFVVPWLSENYFEIHSALVVVVIWVTLTLDIWSPFYSFKRNPYWMITLLGLYWFMSPWFLIVTPLLFLGGVLLFNSIELGALAAIVLMFVPIWTGQLDPHFFASNVGLFITALLCNRQAVFLVMEGQKETVLLAFRKRR